MSITYLKSLARLEGHVGAEDAEALLTWLRAAKRRSVDLSACQSLHTAVLQTLLAVRPALKSPPPGAALQQALGLPLTPTASSRTTP
jgi:hypothetical protein